VLIAGISRNIYICLSHCGNVHAVFLKNREEQTFHYDLAGHQQIGSLDFLGASGLVNYFGKSTDLTQVEISPLLMQKGVTQFALYGLGHLKEETLARLFRDKKVSSLII
jgi:hypothetical protein